MPARTGKLGRFWILRLSFLALFMLAGAASSRAQDTVEYGSAAASSAAKSASISKVLKPATAIMPSASKPAPANTSKTASSYLTIPIGPPADVVNRMALEKKAGKDAAKMLLRSTPSGARVWVNGEFVGSTPLLLIVPPGKYRVRMADSRLDSAQQELGVLPHETREITLPLKVRYPASVSIR